jgi:excisionase family DNA binding protein
MDLHGVLAPPHRPSRARSGASAASLRKAEKDWRDGRAAFTRAGRAGPAGQAAEGLPCPAEAARLIGISRRALEYRIAAGQLRSVRIGRRRLVLVSELRRFLARDWPPLRLPRTTELEDGDVA